MQSVARSLPAAARTRNAALPAMLLALAVSFVPAPCAAQVYPQRPVKIVVGYAPGGGNDIVARLLGKKFQEMTGQAFVIENKTGADSTIASNYVAKSSPDGATLLMTGMGGFTIAPALYAGQLPYDPIKDFVAVGTVARFSYVLATNSSVPARTVDELIAHARANPGKINYGDAAPPTRLATEMFARRTNLALNRVFYKGSAATSQALLTNEVQLVISDATALLEHRASGKINILAVTSRERLKGLPGIPALADTPSLAGFDFDAWVGLFAPAGTPATVVSELSDLIGKVAAQQEFRDKLATLGAEVVGDTPQRAAERVRDDLIRNTEAVRAANMTRE